MIRDGRDVYFIMLAVYSYLLQAKELEVYLLHMMHASTLTDLCITVEHSCIVKIKEKLIPDSLLILSTLSALCAQRLQICFSAFPVGQTLGFRVQAKPTIYWLILGSAFHLQYNSGEKSTHSALHAF